MECYYFICLKIEIRNDNKHYRCELLKTEKTQLLNQQLLELFGCSKGTDIGDHSPSFAIA